ncbi:hypothetical protein J6590_091551 [Homalodisca vitripennis]|nr:hypothetical protein J6590_091551 [Homalodisca vitripennis]
MASRRWNVQEINEDDLVSIFEEIPSDIESEDGLDDVDNINIEELPMFIEDDSGHQQEIIDNNLVLPDDARHAHIVDSSPAEQENDREANCVDIFSKFYNIKSKDKQDLYIQGIVDVTEVQRRVPHQKNVEQPKQPNSFSYHVILGNERVQVCMSNKFYKTLRHEMSEDGSKEEHVLALAFDYMKTALLMHLKPKIVPFPKVSETKLADVRGLMKHLPLDDREWLEVLFDEAN